MSLIFGRSERRSVSYSDLWSRGESISTLSVSTVDQAIRLVPVYAAWRLIADQGSSLPLRAYTDAGGTRQKLEQQPDLCVSPTTTGSIFAWKQRAFISMLSRGNAVGYVTTFDAFGYPATLEWLNPDGVTVDETNLAALRWYYYGRELDPRRVIHVPAMVMPGSVWGVSPIAAFAATFGTGLSAQQTAKDWFDNGAIPSAHLKNNARTVDPDDADKTKRRYRESVRGRDVLVTGRDWDLTTIGVPADQAHFIETLRLTATQVASIYGIPPEMIGGETGSSMTYGTVEQNALNFVTYALRPWLVRLEEALSDAMPEGVYVKFNLDALVRADLKTRMEAHKVALEIGLETNDEGRAIEDRPPLTDAEREQWLETYRKAAAPTPVRVVPDPPDQEPTATPADQPDGGSA